jgi:hypothetical protein
MVHSSSCLLLLVASASAFMAPLQPQHSAFTSSKLYATTAEPPKRDAPGAGKMPEWENRKGKAPGEFLKSDESLQDISGMWECPLTRWDSDK